MNEVEKSRHITEKYKHSEKVYTVYKREETPRGGEWTLIHGSDSQQKVQEYVDLKEKEGKHLSVSCAKPFAKSSRFLYTTKE